MVLVEADGGETDDMVVKRSWLIARALALEPFPQARPTVFNEAVAHSKMAAWHMKTGCGYGDQGTGAATVAP
jgi:hypothetical protein